MGILDSISNVVSTAANKVSETAKNAADKISGKSDSDTEVNSVTDENELVETTEINDGDEEENDSSSVQDILNEVLVYLAENSAFAITAVIADAIEDIKNADSSSEAIEIAKEALEDILSRSAVAKVMEQGAEFGEKIREKIKDALEKLNNGD